MKKATSNARQSGLVQGALRVLSLAIVTAALLCPQFCAQAAFAATPPSIHLTLSSGMEETHPLTLGIKKFAEILEQKSGGRITSDVHPGAVLGTDRELCEQVSAGLIDGHVTATSLVANFSPQLAVFDLPYIFESEQHATAVLNSDIFTRQQELLKGSGITMLTWMKLGWRDITNSKRPVLVPDDMKGIKIRVMENPVMIRMFEAVGAIPTPMAWSELYTALQQKTVDAQENPTYVILNNSLDDVQSHLSLTEHVYSCACLIFSEKRFNEMSPEDQKLVREAAVEARVYQVETATGRENEAVQKMKERGKCAIVEKIDKKPWIEKMRSIYPEFESKLDKAAIQAIIGFKY